MQFITNKLIILIGFYWISILLFLLGLFLTSDHTYSADDSSHQVAQSPPELIRAHRIVLVIIDALRDGFLFEPKYKEKWPKLQRHLNTSRAACSISHVEAPTSTIPRIKALTTGKVVGFSALLDNLNVGTERQDTWLDQLVLRKWIFEFYGDDTWITMFPGKFNRMKGLPTFYLYETEHVDNLIENELQQTLQRPKDWQGLILHHSGIDHIGHVKGVRDPMLMSRLADMDTAMDKILNSLRNSPKDDDWLFILTGDHGMNSEGSHGGSERDEVSTGAAIISSHPQGTPNRTCSRRWEDLPQTQQIDLATFIGIITGAGIPEASVGVVDPVWLETFWPDDPHSQLLVLSVVMKQFAKLSGCQQVSSVNAGIQLNPACISPMFTSDSVVLFNDFSREIQSALAYYRQKASSSFEPKHKVLVDGIQQLLRRTQQKAVVNSQQGNIPFLILGVIGVWLAMVFLCTDCIKSTYTWWTAPGQTEPLPPEKMPLCETSRGTTKPYLSSTCWKLLVFAFLCLLAQSASLSTTTFTHNEKFVWNHYSVSVLLLFFIGCFDYGERDGNGQHEKAAGLLAPVYANRKAIFKDNKFNRSASLAIVCLLSLLWFDRLLLNRVQATMDLLENWSLLNSQYLFQAVSLLLVILLRIVAVYACPWNTMYSGKILLTRLSPVFFGVMMALIQWEYRSNRAAGNLDAMIINARIMFIVLLFDALAAAQWRRSYRYLHTGSEEADGNSHGGAPLRVADNGLWTMCIHPLSTFALLVGFLLRPSQSVTWILVMVKEVFFSWSLRRVLAGRDDTSGDRDADRHKLPADRQHHRAVWHFIVWMIYWIQGWVTFFQQGSTHSLGTVDVAAAYVGLREHYIVFCAPLLVVATFGGPIFWQLACSFRCEGAAWDPLSAKWLASCKTVICLLPLTFVVTACLCMRTSPSVWAVHTPKLIYLIFFQLSLIPFQLSWNVR